MKAYFELLKFRLSFTVAFSCVFGFILASNEVNLFSLFMLFVGGLLVSGSSASVNQIIEKERDVLMTRTATRPLPTLRLSTSEAICFSIICLVAGVAILLSFTNLLTTLLSLLSFILYSFVYTQLKSSRTNRSVCRCYSRCAATITWMDSSNRYNIVRSTDHVWYPVYLAVSTFLGDRLGC